MALTGIQSSTYISSQAIYTLSYMQKEKQKKKKEEKERKKIVVRGQAIPSVTVTMHAWVSGGGAVRRPPLDRLVCN